MESRVSQCYENLTRIFSAIFRALEKGGKLVLLESTVPAWFLGIYKRLYPVPLRFWPLTHPPTFQYGYRDIKASALKAGFVRVEMAFIDRKHHDTWVRNARVDVAIRVSKFVYRKPGP